MRISSFNFDVYSIIEDQNVFKNKFLEKINIMLGASYFPTYTLFHLFLLLQVMKVKTEAKIELLKKSNDGKFPMYLLFFFFFNIRFNVAVFPPS